MTDTSGGPNSTVNVDGTILRINHVRTFRWGGLWGSRRTQSGWEGDRFLEHQQAYFTHAGNGISAQQNGRRTLFVLAVCQNFFTGKLSG